MSGDTPLHIPLHHAIYGFLGSVIGKCGDTKTATAFPNFIPIDVIGAGIL